MPATAGVSRLSASCQLEEISDLPQYVITTANPTPYDIAVSGWGVTFHDKNGSHLAISLTDDEPLEISGDGSYSFSRMQPPALTYDYDGQSLSVAIGCDVTGLS